MGCAKSCLKAAYWQLVVNLLKAFTNLQQQGIYDGDCTANTLNHALLVVGYDQMSTGQEYWILRNQWSAAWGAEGYIYLPISSSDDDTGGACGLLGSKNDFPPVFPSMSSGAIALQSLSVLCFIAAFFVLFLST